jgi:alkylated DNA repair protein (DNA oxidative demethylase)
VSKTLPASPVSEPFPPGFHVLPGYLDVRAQANLLAAVRRVLDRAPLFVQTMPKTGAPLSVRMSNAGQFGWVTDRAGGYRYQGTHPETGEPWPPIPVALLEMWSTLTGESVPPNLCLINYYDGDAHLGMHQDRGASSLEAPVVSISLGDDATFVLGGLTRKAPTRRFTMHSGDCLWFGGPSRLVFHGVERIRLGTSTALRDAGIAEAGRINLTLRRIDGDGRNPGQP